MPELHSCQIPDKKPAEALWFGDLMQVAISQGGTAATLPPVCSEVFGAHTALAYSSLLWLCLDATQGCHLDKNNTKNVYQALAHGLSINLEETPM